MPDVLVVFATKMGSTQEIADVIAGELRVAGLSVDVCPAAEAPDPAGYRTVVLGSALYLRRWRRDALRYLRRHVVELRGAPVWLFQSGPCGSRGSRVEAAGTPVPYAVRRLADRIDSEPPVTFGGRLDRPHAVGPLTRWVAGSAELSGDYRDWASIRAWARGIAATLTGPGLDAAEDSAGRPRP
ncbi:flavodoxin domain-containing protein [Pseudonocardia acaciae]|uniref:flavodoxin domain-containing protein n=1 Tax=Pseudonocardia acaciae TaxID=551276 RepID=UPI00048FA64F|nr:flavodoxin domain-containing protein [Pseudonocardia acaciae]